MTFEGFVPGARVVSVPAQFFTEVVPALDDLPDIVVTLFTMHAISVGRGRHHCARLSDLAASDALRTALMAHGGDDVIVHAFRRAIVHGVLLAVETDDSDALIFVNDEPGRRAYARVQAGHLPDMPRRSRLPHTGALPPNALDIDAPAFVYEHEIGLLSPAVTSAIDDACARYPEAWVTDAIREAALHNARSWAYVSGVLRGWERDGRNGVAANGSSASDTRTTTRQHGAFERVIRR